MTVKYTDRFVAMMLANKHPTIVLTSAGKILRVNRLMLELLNLSGHQDITGQNYFERYVPEEDVAGIRNDIHKVLGGKPTWGYTNTVIKANGLTHTYKWSSVKHPEHNDVVVAWAVDFDAQNELQRQWFQMFSSLVHHFSQPLGKAKMLADCLELKARKEGYETDVVSMTEKLAGNVEDLASMLELFNLFNQTLIESRVESSVDSLLATCGLHHIASELELHQRQAQVSLFPSMVYLLTTAMADTRAISARQNERCGVAQGGVVIEWSTSEYAADSAMQLPVSLHFLELLLSKLGIGEFERRKENGIWHFRLFFPTL